MQPELKTYFWTNIKNTNYFNWYLSVTHLKVSCIFFFLFFFFVNKQKVRFTRIVLEVYQKVLSAFPPSKDNLKNVL